MRKLIRLIQRKLWPGLTPKRRGPYQAYQCVGGPLHGQSLNLHSPGTLTFTLGSKTGRYVRSDTNPNRIYWEGLKND